MLPMMVAEGAYFHPVAHFLTIVGSCRFLGLSAPISCNPIETATGHDSWACFDDDPIADAIMNTRNPHPSHPEPPPQSNQ